MSSLLQIKNIQSITLDDFILIAALPDMGKVGGLVTEHLKKTLDTTEISNITIHDKPWINQKGGIIDYPKDKYELHADVKNRIMIFSGKNQPQEPDTVSDLADKVLELAQNIGKTKMVVTAGGYLPAQDTPEDIFGVATDKKSLELLEALEVGVLTDEVNSITWFNGLILGKAKELGIDGIGLFGKIEDPDSPQYKAASQIVKKIGQMVGQEIDTKELEDQIVEPQVEEEKQSPGIG